LPRSIQISSGTRHRAALAMWQLDEDIGRPLWRNELSEWKNLAKQGMCRIGDRDLAGYFIG
jgi:hypothetical protein